ncbi:auxin efflux carrier [Methanocaldococcus villosus KIN24-T80]|uniref:Auxin efflux carrier n=1 Tax=Methanocaldococcus villosus KIN24-T80 TaxID=1069083 RepID=N6VRP8_9EURY|nr:AEC family transporter [Methanocaldococcus villosus]ENN96545.1 auxin efflux carrier [Methanocaldococcus villosus KIN24-T80]
METVLIIISLVLIGYILKFFNILKESDRRILNNIVIYIAMPSTIFLSILKNLSKSEVIIFLKLPIALFFSFLMCGIISYFLGKFLNLDNKKLGSLILISMLGNTGFLGYPVVLNLFGDEGLVRAIFCDLGSVFITMLVGSYVGVKFGKGGRNVIREVLTFPPLITAIFSIILVLFNFKLTYLPNFLLKTINYLSSTTVPLIMLSLGISLSPNAMRFGIFFGILASIFRFLIAPAFSLSISELLNIKGLERDVLLVESSMPSAMMSLVLGSLYDLDVKIISSAIFITTVLSLFIIALWELIL